MRLIQLLFAALAAATCAHGFVARQALLSGRGSPSSISVARRGGAMPPTTTTTMCVPKEVAGAILVVGAGYLLTQGVPPAKAADVLSVSSSPTCITREVTGSAQQFGDLELLRESAIPEDLLLKALLDA